VTIRVYNLGAVDSPKTFLLLRNAAGESIEKVKVPALPAPMDLVPKWIKVSIHLPEGTDLNSGSIEIDPDNSIIEITRKNNKVIWE